MSKKDSHGVWVAKSEGANWESVNWEDLGQTVFDGTDYAAIGIRIGGQDRIFDCVVQKWRTPEDGSKLPDRRFE